MARLRYDRYGVQGGDVGAFIAPKMGRLAIRRLAERDYNVVHWTEFERGGHFAALEAPAFLVSDIRAFFRRLPAT